MALEHTLRIREKADSGTGEEASPEISDKPSSNVTKATKHPIVTKASLHYLRDRSEWTLPGKDYRQEILKVCREIAEKKTEKDFDVKTENCFLCPFAYMCKKDV